MKNLVLLLSLFCVSGNLFAQTKSGLSPKQEKKIFVNACTDGFTESTVSSDLKISEKKLKKVAKKYCTCSYQTVKAKGYSMEQLTNMNSTELMKLTKECLDELMDKLIQN